MNHQRVVAVDVGATKAALATVTSDFQVEDKVEVPTGANKNIWENIERVLDRYIEKYGSGLTAVGIGSAGPLNIGEGTIDPVNIPEWNNFAIVSHFQEKLGTKDVVMHGDAVALANAEHKLGAGKGLSDFLGLVVSTGIGGGLILNNELQVGISGNGAFFGHATIDHNGPECVCGRRGCVEYYASGPKMVASAQAHGWSEGSDFVTLAESARKGNSIAIKAIEDGARALAAGIVNVMVTCDINAAVIGGGVSQAGDIYWEPFRKSVTEEASFSKFVKNIELRPAALQRDAGLLGAALAVIHPKE